MLPLVKCFLSIWIATNIEVLANDLVTEYFHHKSLTRMAFFSCGEIESDFRFVRRMNALGNSVAVIRPNITFFNVSTEISRKDNWGLGIFLDTRCQAQTINEQIFTQASRYRLYESIHVWLILGTSLEEITQFVDDSAYTLLTDLVVGVENGIGYDLYDIYNPCKLRGGILNVTEFGYWDAEGGLNISLTQDKFSRRANLHEMKVKVLTVVKYQPAGVNIEEHLQDYTMKSQDPVSKYGYAIVRQIADLFNFSMDVQAVDEWVATINFTEVGAMPILHRGEADILASPASASLRFAAKPYGRILMPGYPYRTFFVLRSSVDRIKWAEYLNPFAIDSWLATVFTSMLFIGIISTIQVVEYQAGWLAEVGHAIFSTLGVMCQQGLVTVPNRLAGRVVFLFLLFYGILLSNYYAASVVSARLMEPVDKMNDSLYSLAKSHMTVASEDYRNIDDNLASRSMNEWEVQYFNEKIWTKLPMSRYAPIEEGLRKVAHGGYAYHTSPEVAYPYIGANWDGKAICDMTEIHVITPRILSFWERVDSPFTEIMKIGLIKSANMGLRMRTVKWWKPKTPECSPLTRSMQSITFFEITAAVIMVIVGTVGASMICFVELIIHRLYSAKYHNVILVKEQQFRGIQFN